MKLDTAFIDRCIETLRKAHGLLLQTDTESIDHDLYRSACEKEFELILEQSGKLLKKALRPYYHSPKAVDRLFFKDVFRHAVLHGIMDDETAERWMKYRDNRNDTAHDYGAGFANETLKLLPQFLLDAVALTKTIKQLPDVTEGEA